MLACINYEMNNISLAESLYNYIIEDETATWVLKHSSYHVFLIELENKVKGKCDESKMILKQKAYKKLGNKILLNDIRCTDYCTNDVILSISDFIE